MLPAVLTDTFSIIDIQEIQCPSLVVVVHDFWLDGHEEVAGQGLLPEGAVDAVQCVAVHPCVIHSSLLPVAKPVRSMQPSMISSDRHSETKDTFEQGYQGPHV